MPHSNIYIYPLCCTPRYSALCGKKGEFKKLRSACNRRIRDSAALHSTYSPGRNRSIFPPRARAIKPRCCRCYYYYYSAVVAAPAAPSSSSSSSSSAGSWPRDSGSSKKKRRRKSGLPAARERVKR